MTEYRFLGTCSYCDCEQEVSPNSHYSGGLEADFWCCGTWQYVSFKFSNDPEHWTEGEFSTDENGFVRA
jgi:hypothetical protein